jgi:hypothetical protein
VQTIATTFSAIAMSFGASGDRPAPAPMDQILINKPDQGIKNISLNFSPIDMQEIKKIENDVIALMSTTQCCASGTCENIMSYDDYIDWCTRPDGPPCP